MNEPRTARRSLARAVALCLVALCAACDYLPSKKVPGGKPSPSEEYAVREAFEALKQKDLKRFHGAMITTADFIMRDNGLNEYHDNASYAGSVLKPEELEQQVKDYFTAIHGGSEYIDFSSATFESLGTAVHSDTFEILDGEKIPYNEWSVMIKSGGTTFDTKDLYPRFKVVEWAGGHKVLNLVLSEPGFDDAGGDPTAVADESDE